MKNMQQGYFLGISYTLEDKIERSIKLLRQNEKHALALDPEDGYYLANSFGKYSGCIVKLAELAGVKHVCHHNQTTIDPPELWRFGKEFHPDTIRHAPKENFFKRMEYKGVPSRLIRWCCAEYKEQGGKGKAKILGIRAAESPRRKNMWSELTHWRKNKGVCVNPILYWSDDDVWAFHEKYKIPYCSLYDEGFKRLGCIGCPMAGKNRIKEFERWPGFEKGWKRGLRRYWESHAGKLNKFGKLYYVTRFKRWEDMWDWWLSDKPGPPEDGAEDGCFTGLF